MSVDISHIIKTDFRNTEDRHAAWNFILQTIEMFKKALNIKADEEEWELNEEDMSFNLPDGDWEFSLRKGFWIIESGYHYCQIVMHRGRYFWLRDQVYEIAKLLGQEEAWYTPEFNTWNGGPTEDLDCSFEEWLDFATNKNNGIVPEFDSKLIIAQDDFNKYEIVYHDDFKDIKLYKAETQSNGTSNHIPDGYKPSKNEVEKYLYRWDCLENYVEQERALDKLFLVLCNQNNDLYNILLKCATLNNFYSTNIFDIYSVAMNIYCMNHIDNILAKGDLDHRLAKGDLSLVEEIAHVKVGKDKVERNFYSFATKYCSHHQPSKYAIYDNYVEKVLIFFKDRDHFCKFENKDLKEYPKFMSIVKQFIKHYRLSKFTLKEIDKYLWQLGKEYFSTKKKEK